MWQIIALIAIGIIIGMVLHELLFTDIKIVGNIKQKAKRSGTNLIEDISNIIKPVKKAKKRKLFNRKNKKS